MAAQTDLFQAMTKLTELAEEIEEHIAYFAGGVVRAPRRPITDVLRDVPTALRQSERAGEIAKEISSQAQNLPRSATADLINELARALLDKSAEG